MQFFRDPLIHFLALGAILFAVYGWLNPERDETTIEIGPVLIAQLQQKWEMHWGRRPTEQELQILIEDHVREQVLSRESIAMGLDRGDAVIQRRLAQKMDFLLDDVSGLEYVDESILKQYYQDNPDLFRSEALFSFRHIYINPDKYPDVDEAIADMSRKLESEVAEPAEVKNYGNSFISGVYFTRQTRSQVNRIFGRGFAESLAGLDMNEWSGPVPSGFGFHFILPEDYREPELPDFESVRDEVEKRYLWDRRQVLKENAYKEIRQRYQVNLVREN